MTHSDHFGSDRIFHRRPATTPLAAWIFLCVIVAAHSSHGQLPSTQLNAIYPPGAKQGASLEVTATGANLDMADQIIFSHPGIKGTVKAKAPNEFLDPQPQPGLFDVVVAADVPPGVYEARLTGRYGVSNPRLFVIGEQDEIADNNANRSLETAQELPLNTVVNGKADANQIDYYKVDLKKGQRVLIDCEAWRIDSRLDPVMTVYGKDGEPFAQSQDYEERDAFLDITAPADGAYTIGVRDFLYGGGGEHYYRLRAHSQPHVDFAIPAAVPAGQTTAVTFYGRNLPGGTPALEMPSGQALDKLVVQVTAPAAPSTTPSGYASLSTSKLRSFPFEKDGLTTNLFAARSTNVASEPADTSDQNNNTTPSQISVPIDLTGQFYPAADVDWYQFEAKKGEVYWIEVISHQLGLSTDPVFVIQSVTMDEKGEEQVKEIAFVDDPSDRAGRVATDFDTSTDDPSYQLTAPVDGLYRIRLTDQFGGSRVDPRMLYRLVIRKPSPDFRVTAFLKEFKVANANQVPAFAPQLRQGGAMPIDLHIDRTDGFDGEVTIRAEGLPPSITCGETKVGAQQDTASIIFAATPDAQLWSGPVKLVATGERNGEKVSHDIPVGAVIWGTANRTQEPATFRLLQDFVLSVIPEPSPATVKIGENVELETSLGGKLEVPIKVERRAGHADDLKLTAVNAANEFKPADVNVTKDQGEGKLAIEIKNNAKPGVYTFYLRSDTKVKYETKPEAVTAAEAAQKKLDETVKAIAEEVKQATAAAAKAKTDAAAAKAEQTKADAALKAAQANAAKAKADADAAAQTAKQAADAAAAKPEDAAAKKAAADAQAAADKAKADTDTAVKAATAADEAAKQAKAAADATMKAQTDAEAALKATQDKSARAVAAKKAVDTEVTNVKKAAAAKDVNLAIVSTPVHLRIAPTPIALTATAASELKPDGKLTIPVKVEKKYGFDDAIDITLGLPKGVAGITAAKLQIPKGKTEGTLELSANKTPTPGAHALQIVGKAKFNNVDIEGATEVMVTVPAPEKK